VGCTVPSRSRRIVLNVPSNEQVNRWLTCPLEDLAREVASLEPAPDGMIQNVIGVIRARAAVESARSATESANAAKWSRVTARSTLALACATVALAIVTAIVH